LERIIEERRRQRDNVVGEARAWVSRQRFPLTGVLIGSYARGDFNQWSDVDIIVVSEVFEGLRPAERLEKLDPPPPPGFEVIALTPREFRWGLEKKKPHVLEALERGVVLRDDLGLFRKM